MWTLQLWWIRGAVTVLVGHRFFGEGSPDSVTEAWTLEGTITIIPRGVLRTK